MKSYPNNRKPLWFFSLRHSGIALGIMLSLGLTVGTWRLWTFIQKDLVPLVEENLTKSLNRPFKLGKVERLSLLGVKFAPSEIPAIPTNKNRIIMDGLEISFNLWQLLFQHQLNLDINLVNPDVYIQQDSQETWLSNTLATSSRFGLIKIDLDKLRITNGKLILIPYQANKSDKKALIANPVSLSQLNGLAQLQDNNQLIIFQVGGNVGSGGNIDFRGSVHPETSSGNLQIQVKDIFIPEVSKVLPLPIELQGGRARGNVKIKLTHKQEALMFGKVAVEGMQIKFPQAPETFRQSQGNISFQGMTIKLENITTNYGNIPLAAHGIIHRQDGYQLVGKVRSVELSKALESLQFEVPVYVNGKVKADIKVGGAITQPVISGTVATIIPTYIDKVNFQDIQSKFKFFTSSGLISIWNLQGKTKLGGKITGDGIMKLDDSPSFNFRLVANKFPGDSLTQVYNLKLPLKISKFNATALLTGTPKNFQTFLEWQAPQATYPAKGETIIYPDKTIRFQNVELEVGDGTVVATGTWDNQNWHTILQAADVHIEPFINKEQLPNISLNGVDVNGRFVLSGSSAPFTIDKIDTQRGEIKIGGGTLAISNIRLNKKNVVAQVIATRVKLGQVIKGSHSILANPLNGIFKIAGDINNLSPKTLQLMGNAKLSIDGGTIAVNNIQLISGLYKAQLQFDHVPLQELVEEVPKQFWGRILGKLSIAGSLAPFKFIDTQASGEGRLNLASGIVIAQNIQLNNGRYKAAVTATGISAEEFNEQMRGEMDGKFQVTGIVDKFSLANVRAVGEVNLSQGVGLFKNPLSGVVRWMGNKLVVEKSTSPGLQVNGYLNTKIEDGKLPEINNLSLNISLKNYNLDQLLLNLPATIPVEGKTDFRGKITGTPDKLNIQGQIELNNFVVNQFAFESKLMGTLQTKLDGGLNLDVNGIRDKIDLSFNEEGYPELFSVKGNQASGTGKTQGNKLSINIEKLPLKTLGVQLPSQTPIGTGVIEGELSGYLLINQQTLATSGELAITNPKIGRITGEHLQAKFNYANSTIKLARSELIKGDSRYTFAGNIITDAKSPKIQANINIKQGLVQDIITALQIFEIQDIQGRKATQTYGKSNDLKTKAAGKHQLNLLLQIQRFYEIQALLEQQQRQESGIVPQLSDLKGIINGEIILDTTKSTNVNFKLNGENWVWKNQELNYLYNADSIIAEGSFQNASLRLLPLRIQSKNRLIAFSGNIGSQDQHGKLEIENFPLDLLNKYIKLPVNITGNLNATAALSGSINNPHAIGRASIINGAINQKPLNLADSSFSYTNGRLYFGSELKIINLESVNINGSVPYSLPFATVTPESNKIELHIQVENEGLAVLNLFTDELAFQKGEGEIDIKVDGTWRSPQLNGIARLNDAIFSTRMLPGQLTQVTGEINFDFDRIIVKNIQGNYSLGKVKAHGEIPIASNHNTQIDNPLTVYFDKLLLNLKGLYQGNASGRLEVIGAFLNPNISGNVNLSEGRVILPDNNISIQIPDNNISSQSFSPKPKQIKRIENSSQNNLEYDFASIKFLDLQLNLGKNIEISSPPIFQFLATGTLNVNGSLDNPSPDGIIGLKEGNVNLFTTQLSLARGHNHKAVFTKDKGLDPYLDIVLFAKVLDVIQSTDFNKPNNNGLAALENVRVEASVQGLASQLNDNLVLRSAPARTETEIIALLGGGFGQKHQNGGSTLALMNIAGSAVLNNFQQSFNQIGNSFGLSELRIFPTIIYKNPKAGRSNSKLELATETGIDITPRISASGIKILTTDDPIQLGLNYRMDGEFRLRGSTNFYDDSRATLEFKKRF